MPKPKRTVSRISDAVWVHIFELAVNFIPGYIDIRALRDGRARNKTLTAFALVCKRWAPLAQKVLFRDISLGVAKVDPFGRDGGDGGDGDGDGDYDDDFDFLDLVRDDPYILDDMARTPTGDTEPALISLVNTLAAFHKKGSAIPKNVRALHLGIGRTGGRGYGERDAYLVHGSPDVVAYAVQLCPGLVHFSLTIGAIQAEEGDDSEVIFEPKDIAMLRRNRTLQQLSIATMDDDDLTERADLSPPPLTAANQLVRIFAPTLTFLRIESHGEEGGTLEQMDDDINALPALPKLRTAALHGASDLIKTAVRTGAPNLESVSGLLGDVPTTVKHLQCSVGTTAASLMAYTRLETLDLRSCADPLQLLSGALPPGLHELQFGSQSFNSPDAVKQLKSALRRVNTIKSVRVFHNRYSGEASNFTPPKLHVPVHVVYELRIQIGIPGPSCNTLLFQSYVTDDIIPCPYNTAVGATTVSKAKPSKR